MRALPHASGLPPPHAGFGLLAATSLQSRAAPAGRLLGLAQNAAVAVAALPAVPLASQPVPQRPGNISGRTGRAREAHTNNRSTLLPSAPYLVRSGVGSQGGSVTGSHGVGTGASAA